MPWGRIGFILVAVLGATMTVLGGVVSYRANSPMALLIAGVLLVGIGVLGPRLEGAEYETEGEKRLYRIILAARQRIETLTAEEGIDMHQLRGYLTEIGARLESIQREPKRHPSRPRSVRKDRWINDDYVFWYAIDNEEGASVELSLVATTSTTMLAPICIVEGPDGKRFEHHPHPENLLLPGVDVLTFPTDFHYTGGEHPGLATPGLYRVHWFHPGLPNPDGSFPIKEEIISGRFPYRSKIAPQTSGHDLGS